MFFLKRSDSFKTFGDNTKRNRDWWIYLTLTPDPTKVDTAKVQKTKQEKNPAILWGEKNRILFHFVLLFTLNSPQNAHDVHTKVSLPQTCTEHAVVPQSTHKGMPRGACHSGHCRHLTRNQDTHLVALLYQSTVQNLKYAQKWHLKTIYLQSWVHTGVSRGAAVGTRVPRAH